MQISGFQSGFRQNGKKEKARVARFKRAHSIGQIVEASYVDEYGQDLSWVEINGHYLLAHVTSQTQKGEKFFFEILQLHPHIVLKPVKNTPKKNPHLSILV